MIVYSIDHGQCLVDNYDPMIEDHEKDLPAEVDSVQYDAYDDSWSGFAGDYWQSDNGYQRPNIFS